MFWSAQQISYDGWRKACQDKIGFREAHKNDLQGSVHQGPAVLRYGYGTASDIDFISFAIQMGATIEDMLLHQYATHPELTPKSSDNMYVFAAQDALKKL